jgi:hypothetical protein
MSLTEEAEKEEKNLLQDIRKHPLYQQIYDQIKKDLNN